MPTTGKKIKDQNVMKRNERELCFGSLGTICEGVRMSLRSIGLSGDEAKYMIQ